MNISPDDTEFEESRVKSVDTGTNGCSVEREDGWSFFVPLVEGAVAPQAGDLMRFYGPGIGHPVRGVTYAGVVAFYRTPSEEKARRDAESALYQERRRLALQETKIPDVVQPGFEWTEDMAEISGFGGGYERGCRQMISQGCAWWAEHPDAKPEFHGYKNVTGIAVEDNDDAKALSAAICAGVDPSGAMHQAAVGHVFHWHKVGSWVAYQASMRDLVRERTA